MPGGQASRVEVEGVQQSSSTPGGCRDCPAVKSTVGIVQKLQSELIGPDEE